jgi:hypothetical protein
MLPSGSTIILLKAGYLQTLQEGTYEIHIVYRDGTADGTFSVKNTEPTPTPSLIPQGTEQQKNYRRPAAMRTAFYYASVVSF